MAALPRICTDTRLFAATVCSYKATYTMIDTSHPPATETENATTAADKALRDTAAVVAVAEPDDALPALELSALPEALQQACTRAGWGELMPVQSRALPYLLSGRDLMVQSRTGSGKTGTYLLPLLHTLRPEARTTQALVLVPTRELALQVEREAITLFADTKLSVAAIYGGVGYGKQLDALRDGASLVVGTPGRVLDHLLRKSLTLEHLRALVFDEADRMLSIGFYQDMKDIQRHLPRRRLQATLFSATYPPYVLKLAGEFMHAPDMLSLSHSQVHVAEVQHLYCECKPMDKDRALVRIIETENPSSAIIFCNTKANVHYVTAVLQGFGLNADELSADLPQSKREEVLAKLRRGAVRFLVATDVAARGIDIPELSHVFLYEPPEDRESYIHRAGRTGRAGAAGVVISLVDLMQKLELQRIASYFKINLITMPTPDDQEVARVVASRATALLEARLRHKTSLERERMRRFTDFVHELAADPEQLPLLALLLDDMYQAEQHAPLPVLPSSEPTPKPEGEQNGGRRPRPGKRPERSPDAADAAGTEHGAQAAPRAETGDAPREGAKRRRRRRSGGDA